MFHAITRIGVVCALTLGVAATASAQSAQASANAQQKKEKRHPNQAPDRGTDDPAADLTEPVGVDVAAVPVRVHDNGMRSAVLPEEFMEATTATRQADGGLTFAHYTGLEAAARAVRLLPSRALPLAFPVASPVLEEKE